MSIHMVGNFPLSSSRFLRAEANLDARMGSLPSSTDRMPCISLNAWPMTLA
jgi:hypothetical protein